MKKLQAVLRKLLAPVHDYARPRRCTFSRILCVILTSAILVVCAGGFVVRTSPVIASLICPRVFDGGLFRAFKLLFTIQNFELPEEKEFLLNPAIKNQQDEYDYRLADWTRRNEKLRHLVTNAFNVTVDREQLQRMEPFRFKLSPEENALLMLTLEVFQKVCEDYGLKYFATLGTSLGAYRHHGPIPWDDDIDVLFNASEWRAVRNALISVSGFGLFTQREHTWKFFPLGRWNATEKKVNWPFIDIFFFTEDDTHIWGYTWIMKGYLMSRKKDVFPLQSRPFGGLTIPVPCNLDQAVRRVYDVDICQTSTYDHKSNVMQWGNVRQEPCSFLGRVLPFVTRTRIPGGAFYNEALILGDLVLHQVTVLTEQQACSGS